MVKYKKFWHVFIICFVFLFATAAICMLQEPVQVEAAPKLSKKKLTINENKTAALNVKGASVKVKWKSGNSAVVKIMKKTGSKKQKATIMGVKAGRAKITAKVGKKKLTAVVTVKHVHQFTGRATCTLPDKCVICGAVRQEALGHNWSAATCQKVSTCLRCGLKQGGLMPCSYDATAHCVWCGQLDLHSVIELSLFHTAADGNTGTTWLGLDCENSGDYDFRILGGTNLSYVYPNAGVINPITLYLVSEDDQQLLSQICFAGGEQTYFFDTMNHSTFTYMINGRFQFLAQYDRTKYKITVHVKGNKWDYDFVRL